MPKINLKKFTHGNMPSNMTQKGYLFDKMIILPVISILRINSLKALKDDKTDVVISLTKSNKHPSFNMVKLKGDTLLAVKPSKNL